MIVLYKAFDGTEFENPSDCVKYETLLQMKEYVPMAWDRNLKLISDMPDKERIYDNAMYVFLRTEEDAANFIEWVKYTGGGPSDYAGIDLDCEGLFYWDECDDEYKWVDDEVFESVYKIRTELLK